MRNFYQFIAALSQFRGIFIVLTVFIVMIIALILVATALAHLKEQVDERAERLMREDNLKNMDYESLEKDKKAAVLREIVAPDGVDPNPNSYCIINDGGKDMYVRSLTIIAMPKYDHFANTFVDLLNFPNCTSSIFVQPVPNEVMISKLDKQGKVLRGEREGAVGEGNRQRKLTSQIEDVNHFAGQVERGENQFYKVGFLFTLYADSIRELNNQTALFRKEAQRKNITISSCFAVQAEAFAHNAPLNREAVIESLPVKSEAISWIQFDKFSLSATYNYTHSSFSHKNGIFLGRNMFDNGSPVLFDLYDRSHLGFTHIIAGMTGSGKSAMVKMMGCRYILHGYHFVAIDSHAREGMGEGEYAALAKLCGGVNFKFSSDSSEIMNIFDVSETTLSKTTDENSSLYEERSLDLANKIIMVTYILKTMIRNAVKGVSFTGLMETYINRILVDNVTQVYRNYDIVDGDPDSLYTTPGNPLAADQGITSGRPLKKLPTLTDLYKQLLVSNRDNTDPALNDAYNIALMSLRDYVRELYYSDKTCTFFTAEQVVAYPFVEGGKGREFINDMKQKEHIEEIHGIKPYFDGQSTIHINKDCPFTNIDISQLLDSERQLARQVGMTFVEENFVNKNTENIKTAQKLVYIIDEAHEPLKDPDACGMLENNVRTARKKKVALILITQTVSEFLGNKSTEAILGQATALFIFKQTLKDKPVLKDVIGLTDNQASYIIDVLGGNPKQNAERDAKDMSRGKKSGNDQNKHLGEVCIVDNTGVCFCKVDYMRQTEFIPVETDSKNIENYFTNTGLPSQSPAKTA